MVTHPPNARSASERILLYLQFAQEATQAACTCRDPELMEVLCKQASEWQKLAQEARTELLALRLGGAIHRVT